MKLDIRLATIRLFRNVTVTIPLNLGISITLAQGAFCVRTQKVKRRTERHLRQKEALVAW